MNVVHIQRNPFPDSFSIERLFHDVRAELIKKGISPTVAIAPFRSSGAIARLRNVAWASRIQADICHITGDIHYVGLGVPRSRNVLTIHDLHALTRLKGLRRQLFNVLWVQLPIWKASAISVISQSAKSELLRHCPRAEYKVRVIPNIVSSRFTPATPQASNEVPTILHIGTKPNKNLERLVHAIRDINVTLHIIGERQAAIEEQLKRQSTSYRWESNLTDAELLEAYRRCSILAFVSTYEGFGLPIVEAQWIERPVITSNISSMPEVAGTGALLVDPFSVESIRKGIIELLGSASLRDQLVQAGRVNRMRFSPSSVADGYIAMYRDVLQSR